MKHNYSKIIFIVLAICFFQCVYADKLVPLAKDTIWSGDEYLDEGILVPEGYTLTILPETVVHITGYWNAKIVVKGTLQAKGTQEKPIRFDTGVDNTNYWSGIIFDGENARGILEYCYVKDGLYPAIKCFGASPLIRNSTIMNSDRGYGILCANGAKPVIENNRIETGGKGIAAVQAKR